MKKKLLLLGTASLSFALAISTIAITTGGKKKDNFVKGGDAPTGFNVDFSTVTENLEGHSVLLKDNKGSSISINVVGADYDSENQKFVSKGLGFDFYFYNTTPVRGFSASSFTVYQETTAQVDMIAMLSSNVIDLKNTLNGHATDDFQFFYSYFDCTGEYKMSMDITSFPQLANERYFLVDITPGTNDLSLTDMHLESICDEEITPQAIVNKDGTLTESQLSQINSIFAGQLEITKTGHPTWCFSYNGYYVYDTVMSGSTSAFITAILDSGFEHTADIGGIEAYQKRVGTTVHTIPVSYIRGNFVDTISLMYTDQVPYFGGDTDWPSDFIEEHLSPAHFAQISEFSSEYITKYSYVDHIQGETTTLIIYPTFIEGIAPHQIEQVFNSFVSLYSSKEDWKVVVETPFSTVYQYEDGFLAINVERDGDNITFGIMEVTPRASVPTASEVAAQINKPGLASQIVILAGDENSRYVTDFVTPVPVDNTQCEYTIINPVSGSFESFEDTLVAAGYNQLSESTNDYSYSFNVDSYGSNIRVDVSKNEQGISVRYYYVAAYDVFKSLADALGDAYYTNFSEMCSEFVCDSSYEYWSFASYPNYVLVKNAGSELVDQFVTNSHLTYIPAYDGYRIDASDRVIRAIVEGSDVKVTVTNYYDFDFLAYTDFNSYLTTYIEYQGLSVEDNFVGLSEADNTYQSFKNYESEQFSYLGSYEEVERVHDIYAARILAKPNFSYSEYLDMYINTETGFGYKLTISYNDKYGTTTFDVKMSIDNEFIDFDSFNNLHMDGSQILLEFPALVPDARKDEKLFIDFTDSSDSASVSVKRYEVMDDYISTLFDNGFIQSGNSYSKAVGAYVYEVTIEGEENFERFRFVKYGPYQSISDFRNRLTSETKDYIDSLGFNSFFTSTTPSYALEGEGEKILDFRTTKLSEVQAYQEYLVAQGYKYYPDDNKYAKENTPNVYDTVRFVDHGAYVTVFIEQIVVTFAHTWSDIVARLSDENHSYSFYKDYICYPDDGDGQIYNFDYANEHSCEFTISKSYDLDAYIARIKADPNYISCTESETYKTYGFKDGYINIAYLDYYYRIDIFCHKTKPIDPTGAIPVSEGENDISITKDVTLYEFTATETCSYTITTISDMDTYGYLYDSEGILLTTNDDEGDENNFLIRTKFEEGKTYYIGVKLYSGDPGDIVLSIQKD